MNFGDALQALKSGKKLYRQGWDNGAQFIFLVPGSTFKVNRPPLLGLYPEGTEIEYNGHIDIMTTNGFVQPAVAETPDGRLWFATQAGVGVVDPEAVPSPSRFTHHLFWRR